MSKKTLLIFSQVYPYPLHDGGRMDVFYRIQALHALGHEVILVAFFNPALPPVDDAVLKQYCKQIFPVPYLRRRLSKILKWKPYSVGSRENWAEIDPIIHRLKNEGASIDAVIAESHHVMTVAERAKRVLSIPKLYLRSHNHEPRFMRSIARSSGFFSLKRLFFSIEAAKYTYFLPKLMRALADSDLIWHISFDECEDQKQAFSHLNHRFLPAGIDLAAMREGKRSAGKNVLFAGALFSPNNIHGLRWYLERVHPLLIDRVEGYQLMIAGNTVGADKREVERLAEKERVRVYETPKEMAPIYEEARVFINPMLYGAGVKLKTLDAAIRGLPVVTTTVGNEGTGFAHGREVLVGDAPEVFADHLIGLLSDQERCMELSSAALCFLREHYDQKRVLGELLR